jgi:hypothetical protein
METRMEEGAGDTVTELINGVDFENPKHQSVISNGYGPYAGTLTHGYTVTILFSKMFGNLQRIRRFSFGWLIKPLTIQFC